MTQVEELPFKDIRAHIIEKAMELVSNRVRFRPYGRFPYEPKRIRGLDCIGVLIWVGQEVGLLGEIAPYKPYAFPPSSESFDEILPYVESRNEPAEGRIVILGRRDGTLVHCGLLHAASDGSWAIIGISPTHTRPYVTMYPIADCGDLPRQYYDYRGIN